jgi:hypothetical protein
MTPASKLLGLGLALSGCASVRTDAPGPGSGQPAASPPAASPPAATTRSAGQAGEEPPALAAVEPRRLAATSGELQPLGGARFAIHSPTLRAELGREPRRRAELAFVYQGPTRTDSPLASGELRRQIGLKLRAQDSCNVVYVMWHIEPEPGIVVSVKSNPGQSRHAECSDRGYTFLRPARSTAAPRIEPGEPHVLGAEVRGSSLIVTADGQESWEGELPAAALEFDGPVGLRSDNGEFSAELRAERLASE